MTAETATQPTPHACPVCGDASHLSLLCRADGADVYTCATCSADHVFPMPEERELKTYYDRRDWFEGGEKGGYENYDAQTRGSAAQTASILAPFGGRQGLSILDVGCGYGTHLAAAAALGWRCFGVEPSSHARAIAQQRLGGTAYIVESIADLIPHEFDVVLLLDVIEHLRSPYPTFYQLFSIGAITSKSVVVITTPNAGSDEARRAPAAWPYRHPASHLCHYAAPALIYLLRRLHFSDLDMRGTAPDTTRGATDLSQCAGLIVRASGSDFAEFMRERYVPGTWSKIAEYEHLPRYALAKTMAAGKAVLDFGCGTGYGAAMMAETAATVLGLDIDAAALSWAGQSHRNPVLRFERHDDLGAKLPPASYDLVTCFEMIEHVDLQTQQSAVASMARLLRDDGLLVISTPNPEVTALYGANPYHLREMSEAEFRSLLGTHFPHIEILRQFVRVGVAVEHAEADARLTPSPIAPGTGDSDTKPLAYIALCSRQTLPDVPNRLLFDQATDYIDQFMAKERTLNSTRLNAYTQGERAQSLAGQLDRTVSALNTAIFEKGATEVALQSRTNELAALEGLRQQEKAEATAAFEAKARELATLQYIRQDELSSPRFLSRQLVHATRARIRAILRSRFSRRPGE